MRFLPVLRGVPTELSLKESSRLAGTHLGVAERLRVSAMGDESVCDIPLTALLPPSQLRASVLTLTPPCAARTAAASVAVVAARIRPLGHLTGPVSLLKLNRIPSTVAAMLPPLPRRMPLLPTLVRAISPRPALMEWLPVPSPPTVAARDRTPSLRLVSLRSTCKTDSLDKRVFATG